MINPRNLVTSSNKQIRDYSPVNVPADATPEEREALKDTIRSPYMIQRGERKALTPLGREMIGVAATVTSEEQAAIAFGVNRRTVMRILEGKNASGKEVDGLKEKIAQGVAQVREKVLSRMTVALDQMTPAKLENRDAKELSIITSNLSRVLAATNEKQGPSSSAAVIFVTPEQNKPSAYETIDV